MSRAPIICLRAFQGLMAAVNISLAAYVVNWHLRGNRLTTPSSVNFLLFCPIFSLASILYLEFAPRFAACTTHPLVSLSVEILNSIFYFSGFIAIAVCLGELAFCGGPVCMAGRGAAVLAASQFSAWMGSAILAAQDVIRGGRLGKTAATCLT